MRKYIVTLAALLLASITVSPSYAMEEEAAPIAYTAEGAYAYATTAVQKNGAAFFVLNNTNEQDDKLVSVEGDVAENIELHTHIMDGDKMMMREVKGYDIKAGEPLTLEPMGHHIMLMGLKAPLEAGESFQLELMFEKHQPMAITVEIKNPGEVSSEVGTGKSHGDSGHTHDHHGGHH